MGRSFSVDVDQLKTGAKALRDAASGHRPSVAGHGRYGSSAAHAAVDRFESYWVRGQSALEELTVGLAGALARAADAYQSRDSEDAGRFATERGGLVGF